MIRVLLTVAGVRLWPLKRTTEPLLKLVPLIVSVKAAHGAGPHCVGEMELTVGAGPVTVKGSEPVEFGDWPASKTLTCATVAAAKSVAARIVAVNWFALTKAVVRFDPFHRTTEEAVNPAPFTVSVTSVAVPAVAVVGEMDRR